MPTVANFRIRNFEIMDKVDKKAPEWHAKIAAEIAREYVETNELNETARRRRARIGLMLIWVKEAGKADGSIPHGQFGPWLEKHLPKMPRATAGDYITEAGSICELLHWQKGEIRHFETPPHLLLAAKAESLKGVEKERQKKLMDVVEQLKHFRAVTQYKQVELKDDATVAKKGRRKGEGGASREQRLAHRQKLHDADLKGRKAFLKNLGDALDEAADQTVADPELAEEFNEVFPKLENCFRTWQRIKAARKG